MLKINKCQMPSDSLIYKIPYHYYDAYEGFIAKNEVSIEQVTLAFFKSSPKWINSLFRLRNNIVKYLGLKTTNVNRLDLSEEDIEPGHSIGLFNIIEKCQREIILGENDKHLNFRVSIFIFKKENGHNIIVSTSVQFQNFFGNIYFQFIKLFHRTIVKTMLRNIIKSLS
ncbi:MULTISPECIES: DUF2867 domain-containing protein [unclassified Lysinibacillus]|uniref:DUF2867 domain-containing protein n=1 Tax=unclassified Lysinibacillus TaxID=2636778 RepID=UPI0036F191B3